MPNTFMQIAGLPDDAVDNITKGWVNVKSASFDMSIEIADFKDTKGRTRSTGKNSMGDLEVKKQVDRSSPALYVLSQGGQVLPQVSINFRREDEKDFYQKYVLKDVILASISVSIDDGEHPDETLKLHYREITWSFRPKNKDGTYGEWVSRTWDRQSNGEVGGRK